MFYFRVPKQAWCNNNILRRIVATVMHRLRCNGKSVFIPGMLDIALVRDNLIVLRYGGTSGSYDDCLDD
jgi:hypothetical protein